MNLKKLKDEAEKTLEEVKKLLNGQTKGIIEKGLEYQVESESPEFNCQSLKEHFEMEN